MTSQPYFIGAQETGLERDMEPWLLPDEAYPTLEDAYTWRKRTKRRIGNQFLGRLSQQTSQTYVGAVSNVATTYTNSGTPLTSLPVRPLSVTVVINLYTFTDDGNGGMLQGINPAGSINYLTGVFSLSFAAIGGVGPYDVVVTYSYYPCRSVMGLCTLDQLSVAQPDLIAFDTVKSNVFNTATGYFDDINFFTTSGTAFNWTGTDTDFFDYQNYQGAFFATNGIFGNQIQQITGVPAANPTVVNFAAGTNKIKTGDTVYFQNLSPSATGDVATALNDKSFVVTASTVNSITVAVDTSALANPSVSGQAFILEEEGAGDGIRWYANDANVNGWVNFEPPINSTLVLKGCRTMITFKDRLIVFAPFEGTASGTDAVQRNQRARWCQNGTVFFTLPVPANQTADPLAWRDDIPGRGGFIDAPTSEAIIGVEYIRDIIVVFFEQSSWTLRYTGNEALPFVWARLNVEFGSSSQFSTIPFDQGVLAVGQRALISADGNNVSRIDLKIPTTIFEFIEDTTSARRVHGIRDYINELVFWTYVDSSSDTTYPNKLLLYNYRENNFAIFNDSYTCFGYFTPRTSYLWNTANFFWNDANFFWNSTQAQQLNPKIVAGTNTGYVMILSEDTSNDVQISIMGITVANQAVVTTCGNHNLETGQFVKIVNVQGMTEINNLNTKVEVLSLTTFRCLNIDSSAFSAYTIGGEIIRINNFSIWTKQFNPFAKYGATVALHTLDLYTDFIKDGAISIYVYVDSNSTVPINVPSPGYPQFWQVSYPLDQSNSTFAVDKSWAKFNIHTRGQFVQLQLTLSDEQMLDDDTNTAEFALHALVMYMQKGGNIISR